MAWDATYIGPLNSLASLDKHSTVKYELITDRNHIVFKEAFSEADQDCLADCIPYKLTLHGMMITPSTLFKLSSRQLSTGSNIDCISAVICTSLIRSFNVLRRENLLAPLLGHYVQTHRQFCHICINDRDK